MARRVFYSFHYKPDSWRASQVRNIRALEGNPPAIDNDWEQIKRGGDSAIKHWIENQLNGRTCTVVLVGAATSSRRWILHEITESWNRGMGIVAIHVHLLKDKEGQQCEKGLTPLAEIPIDSSKLSDSAKTYDPPVSSSEAAYAYIRDGLEQWVDEAVAIRKRSNALISKAWRRSENIISVSSNPNAALRKLTEIVKAFGWTIRSCDATQCLLVTRTRPSLLSWGEEVSVRCTESVLGCDISISSAPAVLMDWGRSTENVKRVISAVEKELG